MRSAADGRDMVRRVVRCVPATYMAYRYVLEVALAPAEDARPRLAVILKNPSTASAERGDPTMGKMEAWARRRGYGTLTCVNLFALRGTHPASLNAYPYEVAVGPANDAAIQAAAATADALVAGWGNPNGILPAAYDRRIAEVLRLLDGCPLAVVGALTALGYPRHGLHWNGDAAPHPWPTPR